jgi:glycerol kinase
MAAAAVLALDQGTTSSRALVIDAAGRVLADAQRELPQMYPQPGWVEQDPETIWATQLATGREALARSGLRASDIAALGITNQRETTVVWERATGRPIANAIGWQDRRTAGLCERIRAQGLAPLFRGRTGLVVDAYFSGTKLRWILERVDGARRRAEQGELAFGTVDAWLVWRLTGGRLHVTDASNASRTLLYNIHAHEWDEKLLGVLGVPHAVLPRVVASSGVVGECDPQWFGAPIPIAGIAGDQQASLFGQRCVHPGMVKNTYGTGCFMLMHTGDTPRESAHDLVATVAWHQDGATDYALEGSVFIAGAAIQWLRDGLGLIGSAREVEALAGSVPDTDGVVLVPAFTGLGAPHWDPHARGTIVGLTRGTTRAHLARAALESIAYQTADVLDCMHKDSGIAPGELRVDGGASRNDLLMQFQADVLGVPVARARNAESTALGAALLAGRATGFWSGDAALNDLWQADRVFEPAMTSDRAGTLKARWAEAVSRARRWEESAPGSRGQRA